MEKSYLTPCFIPKLNKNLGGSKIIIWDVSWRKQDGGVTELCASYFTNSALWMWNYSEIKCSLKTNKSQIFWYFETLTIMMHSAEVLHAQWTASMRAARGSRATEVVRRTRSHIQKRLPGSGDIEGLKHTAIVDSSQTVQKRIQCSVQPLAYSQPFVFSLIHTNRI